MPRRTLLTAAVVAATLVAAAPAVAAPAGDGARWAAPLVRALADDGGWSPADDPLRTATRDDLARALAVVTGGTPAVTGSTAPVTGTEAAAAVLRALGLGPEMAGLSRIATADGRRLPVPRGFAAAVLSRELGLRRNHPATVESLERADREPMALGDLLLMADRARGVSSWRRAAMVHYRTITLPAMTPARRTVVQAALAQVGMPYVWAGDWPTPASPWGAQAAGGFDCSGLVWMAFKGAATSVRIGAGRDLLGRTADAMAWEAPRQRVALDALEAGDLVFFGDRGPRTGRGAVGHVGIALGGGWMVHSSGSRAGVSVSRLADYWPSGLARARRPAALGAAGPATGGAAPPVTPRTPPAPGAPRPAPVAPSPVAPSPVAPVVQPPAAGTAPQPLYTAPVPNPPIRRG